MKNTTYSTIWRNKWLTAEATSFDEMIKIYRETANYFEQLKRAGIELDMTAAEDDYIFLRTSDAQLAKEFGLEEDENFDEENDNE